MFGKYSFNNLIKIYNENKPVFDAYLNGDSIECFDGESSEKKNSIVGGIAVWMIVLFIIIHFAIFLFAIYLIVVKWKILPEWAKAISIACLVLNTPFFSILTVYISTMK